MGNFLFGVFVGTVGFGELAPMLDRGVDYIKSGSREYVNNR